MGFEPTPVWFLKPLFLPIGQQCHDGSYLCNYLIISGVEGTRTLSILRARQVLQPIKLRPRVCLFSNSTSVIVADSQSIGKYYFLLYKLLGTGGIATANSKYMHLLCGRRDSNPQNISV